jgi:hypothetical protein
MMCWTTFLARSCRHQRRGGKIQPSFEEHTWTAGGAWISHKEAHISPEDFASLQPDMWLTDGVIIAMVGLETDETETDIYAFDASLIWSSSQNHDSPGSCLSEKGCLLRSQMRFLARVYHMALGNNATTGL